MEVVYAGNLDKNLFKPEEITGYYGDLIELINANNSIEGIVYDDNWRVYYFLIGFSYKRYKRIDGILKYLDLDKSILKKKISQLSKVEFKYILLAFLLINNKNIIIFDHFEATLPYREQKKLIRIIRALQKDGKQIVVVSNNITFLSQFVDRLLIVKKGKIVFDGGILEFLCDERKLIDEPEIIKFIKMANKKGAKLDMTFDNKELLKDIYRSVN